MNVADAVEELVAKVRREAKDKREAALLLKQAQLHLAAHLDVARVGAAFEQSEEAAAAVVAPPPGPDVAEQKRSAAVKQAALEQANTKSTKQ